MTPGELDGELARSLTILRQVSGQSVTGFRAPSFSVTRHTLWSYDIMAKNGIRYDSSVFPVGFHPDYGIRNAPLGAYQATDAIVELPVSCAQVLGCRLPCGGGGYFRIFPYAVTHRLVERCNSEGRPVVFYVHPWEFDPGQPRMHLSRLKEIRHYTNLHLTTSRFDRLLGDFDFGSIRENLALAQPAPRLAASVGPLAPSWGVTAAAG
jgi:polysaccharide deacetylase family protein (PEP-CTERM system associated)